MQGRGRGDLLVRIKVVVPTKLSVRQKELLEEYAALDGDHVDGEPAGIFEKVKNLFE
jgi:molecular chaperone DnaJ